MPNMQFLADLIDWAAKAGTLPMQGLMLLAVIVLGWVIVHLHKQSNTKIDSLHAENKKTQLEWELRIQSERAAMTEERRERITMLVEVIRDDTRVKSELKNAIDNIAKMIDRLEDVLNKVADKRK